MPKPEHQSLIEKAAAMDSTIGQRFSRKIFPDAGTSRAGGGDFSGNHEIKRGPFKQTASGRRYYFLSPVPADIHFPDIAAHLSKMCRYNGATNLFYSVAQHCSLMCDILPQSLKPYALLHDAHEAYTGDLTSPFKGAMESLHRMAGEAVKEIQDRADAAIYPAANLPWPIPQSIKRAIKEADMAMLAAEKNQLLVPADWGMTLPNPAPVKIIPKSWDNAMDEYMLNLEKWVFPHMMMKNSQQNKG